MTERSELSSSGADAQLFAELQTADTQRLQRHLLVLTNADDAVECNLFELDPVPRRRRRRRCSWRASAWNNAAWNNAASLMQHGKALDHTSTTRNASMRGVKKHHDRTKTRSNLPRYVENLSRGFAPVFTPASTRNETVRELSGVSSELEAEITGCRGASASRCIPSTTGRDASRQHPGTAWRLSALLCRELWCLERPSAPHFGVWSTISAEISQQQSAFAERETTAP